jgi:hypothetical protein
MGQIGENGYMMVRCLPVHMLHLRNYSKSFVEVCYIQETDHTILIPKYSRKDAVGHLYEENFVWADDSFLAHSPNIFGALPLAAAFVVGNTSPTPHPPNESCAHLAEKSLIT